MLENNGSFQLACWQRFERFLILGSEQGTFHTNRGISVKENCDSLNQCLTEDYARTINLIVNISNSGRAPKNDSAICSLAVASGYSDEKVRALALSNLSKVCRTGSHLLFFVKHVSVHRRWGRSLRKAISKWYLDQSPNKLAIQLLKYRKRCGWSHRDVLRMCHVTTDSAAHQALFRWTVRNEKTEQANLPELILGFKKLQIASTVEEAFEIIRNHNFTHEMIPKKWKNHAEVWLILLKKRMPMEALLNNLHVFAGHGLFSNPEVVDIFTKQFSDIESLKNSRLHPITILAFLKVWNDWNKKLHWVSNDDVEKILESTFYTTFQNIKPTNKKFLVALDISPSMHHPVSHNMILSCAEVAFAMAMVTSQVEKNCQVVTFSSDNNLEKLEFDRQMKLSQIISIAFKREWGPTDCSLPMVWAMNNKIEVDVFVIYTDNETYAGSALPSVALEEYRLATGIEAKLVIVGMASNGFSIANPNDVGSLDVVGFDTSTPQLISSFVS